MLKNLLLTLGKSALGGSISPEDPYCVDADYIAALYGMRPPHHRPRKQLHYLASSTRIF